MRFSSLLFLLAVSVSAVACYEYVEYEELSPSGEPLSYSSLGLSGLPLKVEDASLDVPFKVSGKMLKPRMENLEYGLPLTEVRQMQFEGEHQHDMNIPLEEMPLEYLPEKKLFDIHRDSKSTETLSTLRLPSKQTIQVKPEYLPTIINNEYHPQSQLFKEISHQNIVVDRRFIQPVVKEQQYEIPVYQRIVTQPIFQKRHFTQPIVEQKTFIQPIITPQLHKAPSYQRRMITLREVAKPKKELTEETLPVKIVQINKNARVDIPVMPLTPVTPLTPTPEKPMMPTNETTPAETEDTPATDEQAPPATTAPAATEQQQ